MEYLSNLLGRDLSAVYFGNTLYDYLLAVSIFIGAVIIFRFIQWAVLRQLARIAQKTKTDLDDMLIRIVQSLRPAFYYFIAFYLTILFLSLDATVTKIINGILIAWVAYQIVIALHILIDYTFERKAEKEGVDGKHSFRFLSNLIKWALWAVAILMVLSNLGINVTSLIAGLGIGGIAVALAAQNILGDLFSSFAIQFDKPFEVGDFIMVGEHSGTVEKIGIKTTRIRALQGEEIVISNQELTSARIQNMKKMQERRSSFTFGVLYETPIEKIKAIPDMVREVIDDLKTSKVRLNRVHFRALGDSALNFEVVYYVPSREFGLYADVQQEINLKLLERFKKEKIEFAYPTQTVYLNK